MKISKFLFGALLSIAGFAASHATAFDGVAIASDSRIAAQQPRQQYMQVSYAEYNAMENRLANLETKLASFENNDLAKAAAHGCTSGCTTCTSCSSCCDHGCCQVDCCSWMNTDCGGFAEAQLLFLRAYDSENAASGASFDTASRYTFGYMGDCGSSIRMRYFEYSTALDLGDDNVQLEYLDTEYASRFCLGNLLRGELSGGFRWAQYDQEDAIKYNNSYGLQVGLSLRGPSIRCWDTFMNLRYSHQFGQANTTTGPETTDTSGHFTITEMQLGLTRDFCCKYGTGYASVFAEAQNWSGMFDDDSQDLGLAGFGFAIGLRR